MILLDTSGALALLDAGEREHGRVKQVVAATVGPLVVTDFVLAELDFLVLKRLGIAAEKELIAQLIEGVFLREPVSDGDLRRASEITTRYRDQELGLTDATLMALTERLEVRRVLTLDRRHFGVFRDARGQALELLP